MAGKMGEVDNDAPPSYVESVQRASISEHRSELLQYIAILPAAIRQSQYEHESQKHEQDRDHITRLVPEVEAFLTYIATLPQQPATAELVMVPEIAVPEQWTLSGSEETRKEGDVVQVSRIRQAKGTGGDAKTKTAAGIPCEVGHSTAKTAEAEFDEWGRWPEPDASGCVSALRWWWRDEDMARRLAAHLLPPRIADPKADCQPPATAPEVPRRGQKRTGSWLPWTKSRGKQVLVSAPLPEQKTAVSADAVSVTARAKEVTFRQQNEMGIYESLSGWGIVLRVTCG